MPTKRRVRMRLGINEHRKSGLAAPGVVCSDARPTTAEWTKEGAVAIYKSPTR
jgi:hypothetical protein